MVGEYAAVDGNAGCLSETVSVTRGGGGGVDVELVKGRLRVVGCDEAITSIAG
jgi:hypothetical protein